MEDVIWVPGKRLCAVQEHLTIKKRKNWNLNVRSFRVAEDINRRTNRTTEDSCAYKKGKNIRGIEKQNGEEKEGCERGFKSCDDPVRYRTRRQQFPRSTSTDITIYQTTRRHNPDDNPSVCVRSLEFWTGNDSKVNRPKLQSVVAFTVI